MEWKTPRLEEIKMDAEIGSYQEDTDRSREAPTTAIEGEPPRDE